MIRKIQPPAFLQKKLDQGLMQKENAEKYAEWKETRNKTIESLNQRLEHETDPAKIEMLQKQLLGLIPTWQDR